jgi:hypothetical protein
MTDDKRPKHKPNQKHTLNEVLKSLQDLIRADLVPTEAPKEPTPPPTTTRPGSVVRAKPRLYDDETLAEPPVERAPSHVARATTTPPAEPLDETLDAPTAPAPEPLSSQAATKSEAKPLSEDDDDFAAVLDALDQLITKEIVEPVQRLRAEPPDLRVVGDAPDSDDIELIGPAEDEPATQQRHGDDAIALRAIFEEPPTLDAPPAPLSEETLEFEASITSEPEAHPEFLDPESPFEFDAELLGDQDDKSPALEPTPGTTPGMPAHATEAEQKSAQPETTTADERREAHSAASTRKLGKKSIPPSDEAQETFRFDLPELDSAPLSIADANATATLDITSSGNRAEKNQPLPPASPEHEPRVTADDNDLGIEDGGVTTNADDTPPTLTVEEIDISGTAFDDEITSQESTSPDTQTEPTEPKTIELEPTRADSGTPTAPLPAPETPSAPEERRKHWRKSPVKAKTVDVNTVNFELEPPKMPERRTVDFDELAPNATTTSTAKTAPPMSVADEPKPEPKATAPAATAPKSSAADKRPEATRAATPAIKAKVGLTDTETRALSVPDDNTNEEITLEALPEPPKPTPAERPPTPAKPSATAKSSASAKPPERRPPSSTAKAAQADDIPVLNEVAEPAAAAPPSTTSLPSAKQARDIAIRVVARLNIERRKAGETPLDIKAIERLQKILKETLSRHEKKDTPLDPHEDD